MTVGLLIDNDQAIASWACNKYNVYEQPVNKSLGIVDSNGKLVGAVLFQNFNGVNIELSYYGSRTVTLGIVRTICRIALEVFRVGRLTVVTSRKNRRLIRGLLKIGFKLEGTQRCFYGHEDTKKNTGVRLAIFRSRLEEIAYKKTEQKLLRNK